MIGLTRESLTKDVSRPLFQLKCYWSTATGIKVFQEDTFSQPVDVIVRSKVQFFHITFEGTRDAAGAMLIIIVSLTTLPLENDVNTFLTVLIAWPPNNHEDEVEHEAHNDNNNNDEYGKKGNAKIE